MYKYYMLTHLQHLLMIELLAALAHVGDKA